MVEFLFSTNTPVLASAFLEIEFYDTTLFQGIQARATRNRPSG